MKKALRIPALALAAALLALPVILMGGQVAVAAISQVRAPFTPVLIIDPGHGGFDGGAVGSDGAVEKEINLAVSLKLAQLAELHGFEVVMTRETDISIHDEAVTGIRNRKVSDLNNRLELAQRYPEALFLSIHQNHFPGKSSWGAQVFYGPKNSDSQALAETLQHNLVALLQPHNKRATKPAEKNLYLLYNVENPAVLIECGFLSNRDECERLQQPDYQQELAFVILQSVIEFYESSERKGDV